MNSRLTAGMLVRVAFSCLLVVCIFTSQAHADEPAGTKKVLALFQSEGWSAPSHRVVYNGMKTVFDQSPRQDVILLGDNLDLPFAVADTEQRRLADFFRAKYAGEDIDVVVPVTRTSLEFVLRYRDIMFPGIPIVFCLHSARELHRLDRASDVTGVAITVDIAGTIDLARNLQPGLRRLAVVAGTALVDRSLTSLAREIFKKDFQGQLEWIDLTGLHMQELLERVSQLPDSTAILYPESAAGCLQETLCPCGGHATGVEIGQRPCLQSDRYRFGLWKRGGAPDDYRGLWPRNSEDRFEGAFG